MSSPSRSGGAFGSIHVSSAGGSRITGMRSWYACICSFAAQVTIEAARIDDEGGDGGVIKGCERSWRSPTSLGRTRWRGAQRRRKAQSWGTASRAGGEKPPEIASSWVKVGATPKGFQKWPLTPHRRSQVWCSRFLDSCSSCVTYEVQFSTLMGKND